MYVCVCVCVMKTFEQLDTYGINCKTHVANNTEYYFIL